MTERTSQRRVTLALLLLVIGTRAFAGAPELDGHGHTQSTDAHVHELVLEHTHDAANDNDDDRHFHCHTGCGDTPLAVPSIPPIPLANIPLTRLLSLAHAEVSPPPFAHFRPPRP